MRRHQLVQRPDIGSFLISDAFKRYFRLVPADTDALREEVYRIRYEVYCKEFGYEKASDFPDRMEQDAFDPFSRHCLLMHKPSEVYAGTVRLIMTDPAKPASPLPFELACARHLDTAALDIEGVDRRRFGEISRLAVRSSFRRRPGEKGTVAGIVQEPNSAMEGERRVFPHIALGLYLAAASIGLLSGLSCVFVMMEPRLARRLRHFGINFHLVGELVDYHGMRGPFRITREALLADLSDEIRNLLNLVSDDIRIARGWGFVHDRTHDRP